MNRRSFITALSSVATLHTLRRRRRFSLNFGSSSAITTTRYPYVQNVRNDQVCILWATLESGTGVVEYSSDGINFNGALATQRAFTALESGGTTDFVQYEAVIYGLQPSTDY